MLVIPSLLEAKASGSLGVRSSIPPGQRDETSSLLKIQMGAIGKKKYDIRNKMLNGRIRKHIEKIFQEVE